MARFRMFNIKTDQFAILADNMPSNEVGLHVAIRFKYADNGRKIGCAVEFDFSAGENKLVILHVTCEFEINPADWETFVKDEIVTIPKSLLEYFAVHTIGTARGILHCKTEGTPFNGIILPPLDATKLVRDDLKINICNPK